MINIDASEIFDFSGNMSRAGQMFEGELADTNLAVLHRGIDYAKEYAPRDEGNLAADIRILEGPTAQGGAYGTDMVYAWQREEGGTIYPRNGKFLVFEVDGELVFARKVTQSGTQYMARSAEMMRSELDGFYTRLLRRILEAI